MAADKFRRKFPFVTQLERTGDNRYGQSGLFQNLLLPVKRGQASNFVGITYTYRKECRCVFEMEKFKSFIIRYI
jgi:hypothetical protein